MASSRRKLEADRQKILVAFGERLRSLRESEGISQERLAALAGLDRSYVGGVERGERNIALHNIVRLSIALGVRPGVLLDDMP